MPVSALLAPLFVQVFLTFLLMYRMAGARVASLRRREVKMGQIALGNDAWPERVKQLSNSFHNQLELPLLFYVLVALVLITRHTDIVLVALAWAFVALRIVHAFIHVTSNIVTRRFYAFAASSLVLLMMWVYFAARILLA
jgi:hypothetical protein